MCISFSSIEIILLFIAQSWNRYMTFLYFFYMFPVDRRGNWHKQNTIHKGIWNWKNWHYLSILSSLKTQGFDIIIRHHKCKILKYFYFYFFVVNKSNSYEWCFETEFMNFCHSSEGIQYRRKSIYNKERYISKSRITKHENIFVRIL